MKSSSYPTLLSLLTLFFTLLLTGTMAAAGTQRSVAILPFTLNAPPDMQYLQE